MMERPRPARPLAAALGLCVFCVCVASCLSPSGSARYSSGPAFIVLPPESWPESCPLVFVDASGNAIRGAVRSDSVRLRAFGLSAVVKDARIEEDGSVAASALVFEAVKGRKGGKLTLDEPRLKPLSGDSSGGIIEFSTQDGWRIGIEGCGTESDDSSFRGVMLSFPEETAPGETASSSARFEGLSLTGKAQADWSRAGLSEIEVLLDMESGEDVLVSGAAEVALDSGALSLSCDLSLPGGSALSGESSPGALSFPSCRISGGGKISIPGTATGPAGYRLTGGFSLSLSNAVFSNGDFLAAGTLFFPPEWKTDAPLSFPAGSVTVRGIRALSLDTGISDRTVRFSAFGARLEASGLSFSHRGKAGVSVRDAAILSLSAEGEGDVEGESDFRIPLGPVSMEDGILKPGERSFTEAIAVPGYARSFNLTRLGWGPGGFRLAGRATLPGFLGTAPIDLPELSLGASRELSQTQASEDHVCEFLGLPYAMKGLRLMPGGSASLDSLLPASNGAGRLRAEKIVIGADGNLFPGFVASLPDLAGPNDFEASAIAAALEGGLRVSGSVVAGFASEGHIFSGRLETDDLRVSAAGELGIGEYRWLKERVPAFLGLVFRKTEFAFRKGRAFLVLSEGIFAGKGVWPSGGEMHGLGLDLDSMKYDLSGLSFPEPAVLTRPEGRFTLSAFLSALDDAYLFSGTARLKALPDAPWEEGEELGMELLRLDAYGNIRELRLMHEGTILDGKAWIR